MIDLEDFRSRYRLGWDESRIGQERDPWLRQIPCTNGHISPHGDRTLAVSLTRRTQTAKRIMSEIPGARIHQQGDNEVSIVFDVGHLDAVAKIVGARRRRKLSEKQKADQLERLAKFRFKSPQPKSVA